MPSLDGKVAIVTGAGRGIGREHALALANAGAKVVVNDLGGSTAGEGADQTPAQQVADEIKGRGGEATANYDNVADFEAAGNMIRQAVSDFGRLDILVNNAGILRDRMLVSMTEEEWDAVIAVHLKGHFAPTHHAANYWRQQTKAGEQVNARVINTSSPSGVFGNVGQTNYGSAKAGIAAFTVIAAQELSRYGVTVNCLAPNARTRMTENIFGALPTPAEGEYDPLDPGNISPVVVALCTDDAREITGQCFFIYGSAINVLKPWDVGTLIQQGENVWDPDKLAAELKRSFPKGLAPVGMMEMLARASGQAGA
jgi:NAD(P)-dependent dehydrogenase (short-subunit alcohol dehydrogenase family)